MNRHSSVTAFVTAAILWSGAPSHARAQAIDVASDKPLPSPAVDAQGGAFVPNLSSARAPSGVGVGYFVAGYNKADSSAVFVASAEAFLFSRVALRAGGVYVPTGAAQPSLQPQVELRWHLTAQERSGVDAAVGLVYRRDRITQDGGIVQAVASLGRRFGNLGATANLAYGQDDEGNDRLTELRLASLWRVADVWVVGATGSAATGWGSTDPRRAARGEANYELQAGPVASYSVGKFALLGQAGVDAVRTTHSVSGLFAFGGLGSAF
jgi:hypothetical protein